MREVLIKVTVTTDWSDRELIDEIEDAACRILQGRGRAQIEIEEF